MFLLFRRCSAKLIYVVLTWLNNIFILVLYVFEYVKLI